MPVVQPAGAEARAPQGHPAGGAAGPAGHPGAAGAAGAGGHHARALARGAGRLPAGLHRGGARVQGAPPCAACTSHSSACFYVPMRPFGTCSLGRAAFIRVTLPRSWGAARAQVLACALLQDLGAAPDGPRCGELAAFCVSPAYRGSGRGDALLDYVEQSARDQGMRRLVLLTTRTADWCDFPIAAGRRMECVLCRELIKGSGSRFQQRDFEPAGPRAPERAAARAAARVGGPEAQLAAVREDHL